ncbi:MAG: cytochrome bc complex cytochrome b subunit [Candidatus Nanopelagicales bacterium]
MSVIVNEAGKAISRADERAPISSLAKSNLRKIFPDHWSFMLGEIALYSFLILLLTGVYLTVFFKPSMTEVVYHGSYAPLEGVPMSEAYASALDISFDVRGGLLIRQIHHWAALFFMAAMMVHMFRIFFTGAFRKPREFNWVIGGSMIIIGLLEGFAGYSLPDDLLSGVGVRIVAGIIESIPVVGTYLLFFIFGGQYPGNDFIPRLYSFHILLVPGILLALVGLHLVLIFYHKHTQYPGPGRTNNNVVGYPLFPVYTAKAGGFFFVVFGVTALMGGLVTINPIWAYGPYVPDQVTAGSQPDWYIGFVDGALRAFPSWEWADFLGHTWSWNIFLPCVVMPGVLLMLLLAYPFLEAWITGDHREHHLLDRPRNAPTRTGIGVMAITFWGVLVINGANDIIAQAFDISFNSITWFTRIGIFILPPLAFLATRRFCLGLQRRDRELLLHGRESGQILRLPHGEFIEIHTPITEEEKAKILGGKVDMPVLEAPPATDANGVATPGLKAKKRRARFSRLWFDDNVARPTEAELEEAAHHGHEEHDHEVAELAAGGKDVPATLGPDSH